MKKNIVSNFKFLIGQRWWALGVFTFLITVVSIVEGFSLGSLYPLMNIILDESKKLIYLEKVNLFFHWHLDASGFTTLFLLSILLLFFIKNTLVILAVYGQYYLSQMMCVDWQTRIFRNYLKRRYDFFIRSQTGDLIQKQMVHTLSCGSAILYLCAIARDILSAVGTLIVLSFISFKIVVAIIVIIVLSAFGFLWISKHRIYRTSQVYADLQQYAFSLIAEAINGIKEIKLFNAERYFSDNFRKTVFRQANIYTKNATIGMSPSVIMQMVAVTILVVVMMFIFKLGINSVAVFPVLVVFGGGIHQLIRLASSVNSGVLQLSTTLPSVPIVAEMLSPEQSFESDRSVEDSISFYKLPEKPSEKSVCPVLFLKQIELRNISFSYPDTSHQQLKEVDGVFIKGKFYGIVGPSGCGKTTLVDVLIGIHSLQQGNIILDGKSIKDYDAASWRALFGFVSQHPFIFSGTFEQNIAFAVDPLKVDNAKVAYAARLAGLEPVVQCLDRGFKTVVGEKGYRLSGGERQRLSIARTIYRDPQIYIFDEATSSLDSESEREIQKSIEVLSGEKKTIIAIAHRISTIMRADELIVMHDGRVVERGNHVSLLKAGGIYARLYKAQYGG